MGIETGKTTGILVDLRFHPLGVIRMDILEIQSLAINYGSNPALRDISLSVGAGEILALVGPNGAGKTTLIRAASGILPSNAGRVLVRGKDISHLSEIQRARLLAVVPQARKLPPAFTVKQTVLLGRTPYLNWLGQPGNNDQQSIHWAMERTQTLPLADCRIDEISGGEQQRVLLARALAQQTPLLLLDEPTAHLDLHHQTGILALIRELVDEQKLAVLMALHDLNLVSLYADRVALLVKGKLRAIGTPPQVLTPQQLSDVYQTPIHVIPHPDYNTPLILLDGHDPKIKSRLANSEQTDIYT
jgi:iron complex transport system ATP-binding protein